MKHINKFLFLTIAGFAAYYLVNKLFFAELYNYLKATTEHIPFSYFTTYLIVGLPMVAVLFLLHTPNKVLESMGISTGFLRGLAVALICTLPMLLGYAGVFQFNTELTWTKIFTGAICAALFEELFFRGFLFGQIFRYTRFGFFPVIIFGAILFAIGHLYQSQDPGTLVGIFLTTFLGAGLFAWVFVEWDFNLWVAIWLHLLMNLYWMLFSAGENALGGVYSNVFRVLTITLVIVGTIVYKRRKGLALAVNRETLWMERGD